MTDFHRRLRILQERSGLNCEEFAKMIGVSSSTYSFYRKDREPGYEKLLEIARIFNTTPNWLLGYSDDQNDKADIASVNNALIEKLNKIKEIASI